jgi:hypothetical protein
MEKKTCLDEAPIQSIKHKHLILWGVKYRLAQSRSHYSVGLIHSDMEDIVRNAGSMGRDFCLARQHESATVLQKPSTFMHYRNLFSSNFFIVKLQNNCRQHNNFHILI